jgi:hypothetical protein
MRKFLFASLALTLFLSGPAVADEAVAEKKLGDSYKTADDVQKYVMVLVAKADKVLTYKEQPPCIDSIVRRYFAASKTSAEKLAKVGELRKAVTAALKPLNVVRRKEKKRYVGLTDPASSLQQALAARYVYDTAGVAPTLKGLECLATVRDCLSWGSTGDLIHAFIQDALLRDAAYLKADHGARLAIINGLDGKKMMSSFTRTKLEKPVLVDWISAQLKAGTSTADISKALADMGRSKTICFFSKSWADGYVKQMGSIKFGE